MDTKEQKKQELIHSSCAVFLKYGYRKTTMDDLASAAGMTKSSLYHYFRNKDELLLAVADSIFESDMQQWREALAQGETLDEAFIHFADVASKLRADIRSQLAVLWGEMTDVLPVMQGAIERYQQEMYELVRDRVQMSVDVGELKDGMPVDDISAILIMILHHIIVHERGEIPFHLVHGRPERIFSVLLDPYRKSL